MFACQKVNEFEIAGVRISVVDINEIISTFILKPNLLCPELTKQGSADKIANMTRLRTWQDRLFC